MKTALPKHVPELLRELADAAGIAAAEKLAAHWGGRRLYVPKLATKGLVNLLGRQAAEWLSQNHGGCRVVVPMGKTTRAAIVSNRIAELLKAGASTSQIAATVGVSERTVQRHRACIAKAA
jgi:DNA-binding NarL/FixJ family response regulator